jgi:hypothetical protein
MPIDGIEIGIAYDLSGVVDRGGDPAESIGANATKRIKDSNAVPTTVIDSGIIDALPDDPACNLAGLVDARWANGLGCLDY